jgi:hypothetical protein
MSNHSAVLQYVTSRGRYAIANKKYVTQCLLSVCHKPVCLSLLHSFVTVNISGVGSLTPRPVPNLVDQELHFIWPLPSDLSGMGGPTSSLYAQARVALWATAVCKSPLHNGVVVC